MRFELNLDRSWGGRWEGSGSPDLELRRRMRCGVRIVVEGSRDVVGGEAGVDAVPTGGIVEVWVLRVTGDEVLWLLLVLVLLGDRVWVRYRMRMTDGVHHAGVARRDIVETVRGSGGGREEARGDGRGCRDGSVSTSDPSADANLQRLRRGGSCTA